MNLDLSHLHSKLVLPLDYKTIEFWLVGAGGTGSFMAMNLARLGFELKTTGKRVNLNIVDPDTVEEKNIPRSNFCFAEIGQKKAETLSHRIAQAWGIEVGYVNESFHPSLLETGRDDWNTKHLDSNKLIILVGCVDNYSARKELHETLKFHNEKGYRSVPHLWWIDGGNAASNGQVLIGNRLDKKEISEAAAVSPILSLLPAPSLQHPELLEPEIFDSNRQSDGRSRMTCAERIRLGEQSLNINQRVAVEMSEILSELLLSQNLKRCAVYFDLESGVSRSVYTTSEAVARAVHFQPVPGKKIRAVNSEGVV